MSTWSRDRECQLWVIRIILTIPKTKSPEGRYFSAKLFDLPKYPSPSLSVWISGGNFHHSLPTPRISVRSRSTRLPISSAPKASTLLIFDDNFLTYLLNIRLWIGLGFSSISSSPTGSPWHKSTKMRTPTQPTTPTPLIMPKWAD